MPSRKSKRGLSLGLGIVAILGFLGSNNAPCLPTQVKLVVSGDYECVSTEDYELIKKTLKEEYKKNPGYDFDINYRSFLQSVLSHELDQRGGLTIPAGKAPKDELIKLLD